MKKFACLRCGNCCKPRGYVRLREGEIERLAEFLGIKVEEALEKYARLTDDRTSLSLTEKPDHSCVFLSDDGHCFINDVKPKQCRDFPERWNYEESAGFCAGLKRLSGSG